MRGILRRPHVANSLGGSVTSGATGAASSTADGSSAGGSTSTAAGQGHLDAPPKLRKEGSDSGASISSAAGNSSAAAEQRETGLHPLLHPAGSDGTSGTGHSSHGGSAASAQPRVTLGVKEDNESLVVACEAAATSMLRRHERAAYSRVADMLEVFRDLLATIVHHLEGLRSNTRNRSSSMSDNYDVQRESSDSKTSDGPGHVDCVLNAEELTRVSQCLYSVRTWDYTEVHVGYAQQNREFARALAREVAIDATGAMEVCALELCEAAAGRAQHRKDGIVRAVHVGEAAEYSRVMVRDSVSV